MLVSTGDWERAIFGSVYLDSGKKAAISYDGKRYTTSEHFRVSAISYASNREIEGLEICNAKGGVVFRMQLAGTSSNKPGRVSKQPEHSCRIKCGRILQKELESGQESRWNRYWRVTI